MLWDEDDDIYLTRPEDVRRALEKNRNFTNDHDRPEILPEEHLRQSMSTVSMDTTNGAYLVARTSANAPQ